MLKMDVTLSACSEENDSERSYGLNTDRKRKTRNENEKKRRDQFNDLIEELMLLVNHGSKKKMDKSLVLETTISILRHQKEDKKVKNGSEDAKPAFLSTAEYCQHMLEALDGFLVVVSQDWNILYVSDNVTAVLGHLPSSMIGKSLFSILHPSDHQNVKNQLQMPIFVPAFLQPENQTEFFCHFERNSIKKLKPLSPEYCFCKVAGGFKSHCEQTSESCIVLLANSVHPILSKDVCVIDENNNEFISRFSLEWKILFLDHRASSIIGYSPFEVVGTCGYEYYHFDDLEHVSQCHEKLIKCGQVTSGYYRFLTKDQQWIWLKSHYNISFNQWTCKPEFVVCTNSVVSYHEVVKYNEELLKNSSENIDVPTIDVNTTNQSTENMEWQDEDSQSGEQIFNVGDESMLEPNHGVKKAAKHWPNWSNFSSMPEMIMQPFEKIRSLPYSIVSFNKENLLKREGQLVNMICKQQYELEKVQKQIAECSNQDLFISESISDDLLLPSSARDFGNITEDLYNIDWSNFI